MVGHRSWSHLRHAAGAMAPTYDPAKVEEDWYGWWKSNGLFNNPEADTDVRRATFSMVHSPVCGARGCRNVVSIPQVIPPPNVTGALHIGHATTIAIQVRRLRCCLWPLSRC